MVAYLNRTSRDNPKSNPRGQCGLLLRQRYYLTGKAGALTQSRHVPSLHSRSPWQGTEELHCHPGQPQFYQVLSVGCPCNWPGERVPPTHGLQALDSHWLTALQGLDLEHDQPWQPQVQGRQVPDMHSNSPEHGLLELQDCNRDPTSSETNKPRVWRRRGTYPTQTTPDAFLARLRNTLKLVLARARR